MPILAPPLYEHDIVFLHDIFPQVTVKGNVQIEGMSKDKPSEACAWINLTHVQMDDERSTAVADNPIFMPGDKDGPGHTDKINTICILK